MRIESTEGINEELRGMELEISLSGTVKTDATWRNEPTYSSFTRIYYVTEGSGVLTSDRGEMPLEGGYVYIAPCGMKCGFYGTPSVSKLFFHVNLSVGDNRLDAFESYGTLARLPRSVEHIERLKRWYHSEDAMDKFYLKSELYGTLCEFLRLAGGGAAGKHGYSTTVLDAINYIRRHLSSALCVGEIAEKTYSSRSRLCRLFKSEVGYTVTQYVDELLMSEAQAQLLYSDKTVAEIGNGLGYCDQFYFSRRFTKRFGLPPRDYRRNRGCDGGDKKREE